MKNRLALGSLFALLICLSGCGSSPDSLMKQQIDLMNDTADAMESDASESEMKELEERGKALKEKMENLDLSDEEKKQLVEKNKDEYSKALSRLMQAAMDKSLKDMGKGLPAMPTGGS